jgi:hypothetical protein
MKLKEKVNEGQIYRLIDLNEKIIFDGMANRAGYLRALPSCSLRRLARKSPDRVNT